MTGVVWVRALYAASFAALFACSPGNGPLTPESASDAIPSSLSGAGTETVLHSFSGADGAGPVSNVLAGSSGEIYGTTLFGGKGAGCVFELRPASSGYVETIAYDFNGGLDGISPWGIAGGEKGVIFGITFLGGSSGNGGHGWGTVYALTAGSSGFTERVLYRFKGSPDGWEPIGPPVVARDGSILGVTSYGGTYNSGTIFRLMPRESGYKESIVYSFPGGSGGNLPQAGLTIDARGNIYGTTMYGGSTQRHCNAGGCGTVFKLTPTGSGYDERVIHAFTGSDGDLPFGTLTVNERTGAVFGTTFWGGAHADGTVFQLSPHGSSYSESVLYSFEGKSDGFLPEGTLLLRRGGTLYGTAALGGGGCNGIGCGTVFSLEPSGSHYSFHLLLDFKNPANGAEPQQTSLLMDRLGALYGTTRSGGAGTDCSDGGPGGAAGCGTVFRLAP